MNKKDLVKNKRLYTTYGITIDNWQYMYTLQEGKCKVCGEVPKNKVLCVDHRHVPKYKTLKSELKAKEVRSLVCFRCNRYLLGPIEKYFKDPRKAAVCLVNYLMNHKTKGD